MRASANRTQDNESRAVANNVSCKREERQAVHLVDNSPHTKRIAQFQAMMDKSMNPHQVQLRKFREMIDNSPQRKKIVLPGVTQKKGPLDEDELQFKSKEAVQKKGPLDEDELQFKKGETVQCKGPLDEDELQFKSKEAVQKKGPLDEEELQFKSKEAVQKKGPLDEDELQFKKDETVQCKGPLDEDELQFKAEEPVQKQENRTGLPDDLKAGVENLSGLAMDDVRVHYNSGKPAQLNAYAYTQGTEIHVAPGQEKHLPHEAWHVVQQKQGRVQPTVQMAGGVPVNDDKGLEREADVAGEKSLQFKAAESEQKKEGLPYRNIWFDSTNSQLMSKENNRLKCDQKECLQRFTMSKDGVVGNLNIDEEENGPHGGHTISTHVVPEAVAKERLNDPAIPAAGFWVSKDAAQKAFKKAVTEDRQLKHWAGKSDYAPQQKKITTENVKDAKVVTRQAGGKTSTISTGNIEGWVSKLGNNNPFTPNTPQKAIGLVTIYPIPKDR